MLLQPLRGGGDVGGYPLGRRERPQRDVGG
jgi:hypothetical protein